MRKIPHLQQIVRALRSESGAAAAELALVLPVAVLVTLGSIGVCMMIYATSTLHYAAEDAARCVSVKTTVCTGQTSMSTYALSHYHGPTTSPTFTLTLATSTSCGNQVAATSTFRLVTGLVTFSVPINATACYPSNT